jgi:DNA-binding transcriptional ArsR family regulator
MDDATRICALLLRHGTVPRAEVPQLDHAAVREEVEERLGGVGLVLATSAYSPDVGMRLSPAVTADPGFDAASNLGLKADACALLVILWARLVLQKRTATERREPPGQQALLEDERREQARTFRPALRFETLVREFGPVLGSRSHIQALVTMLRRLGFVAGRGERLEAGPLLELGIDGERMIAFIRRGVLREALEANGGSEDEGEADDSPTSETAAQLLRVMQQLARPVSMGDLVRETRESQTRLRRTLRELEAAGSVLRTGERRATRYRLAEAES